MVILGIGRRAGKLSVLRIAASEYPLADRPGTRIEPVPRWRRYSSRLQPQRRRSTRRCRHGGSAMSDFDPRDIRALVFDVFGTVVD
ncbi:MAG: hypothetical protein KGK18_11740, partial [Burkholderiales bacterium]|nr:hypothetical protein [Burkholderiales bacterium]